MHLVPESAIVQASPQKTFGEMRQAMVVKSHSKSTRNFGGDARNEQIEDISIGCGFSDFEDDTDAISTVPARRRRRLRDGQLQHVVDVARAFADGLWRGAARERWWCAHAAMSCLSDPLTF